MNEQNEGLHAEIFSLYRNLPRKHISLPLIAVYQHFIMIKSRVSPYAE
jgi:hypothetical protein